ncbi:MAG: type I restriction-modification system subunit M [Gemmatimonadota bacterium]|nr:type I restriction-modification system subunit M [Gemmatimonadota bacterium]
MTLTLQQLETHLWKAADILRGRIDSGEYKHYIFGLLFFKRLSDVWQEEYEERLERYNGNEDLAADPDEHRFHIPEGHFWDDVRTQTTDIGASLNQALDAIEDANLRLKGIFQDVDFNNKDRFTDAVLEELLQHFDRYRLRRSDAEPDVLGAAYEYLIAQFADDAGKKGGEFYTPKMVVRLIVEMLQPDDGMHVYDPACGSGGMLLEALHYVERQGGNPRSLSLFGQELNLNTWAICRMNLFLHDIDGAEIARGDTLRDPKHLTPSNTLRRFDRVLANPPFSLKQWGHKEWKDGDRFGRDVYGCPPKSYGDYAFVQHMVASLKSDGMLGVVLPHGVLFRGGAEGRIREGLVKDDLIEAVVGLGPHLFYGAGIPACIVVINRAKPEERKGRVLFVHGAEELVEGKAQNHLSQENVDRLAAAFHAWEDEERFCRVVDLDEIEKNDFNLNIPRYVDTTEPEEPIDVAEELGTLKELMAERDEAERKMLGYLEELGYGA